VIGRQLSGQQLEIRHGLSQAIDRFNYEGFGMIGRNDDVDCGMRVLSKVPHKSI
jgi:hypothetical protein